jgi:ATP-dependent Lon protease
MDKKELQRRAGIITEVQSSEETRMFEIAAELADLMLGSPIPQNVLRQVEDRAREYYRREAMKRQRKS